MSEGLVYLLHYDQAVGHAQHYLGWTSRRVEDRVQDHIDGTSGARLALEFARRRIAPEVVKVWPGNKALERRFKNRKNHRGLCPKCLPGLRRYERERRQAERDKAKLCR